MLSIAETGKRFDLDGLSTPATESGFGADGTALSPTLTLMNAHFPGLSGRTEKSPRCSASNAVGFFCPFFLLGQILEVEIGPKLVVRFPIDFDVGINQEIDRACLLRRHQSKISPLREDDAIRREMTEVVLFHRRMLFGLANIDGNPMRPIGEHGPAMIPSDMTLLGVGWNRETDFEPRGDPLAATNGDEQAVEVGTITEPRFTGPDRVAPSP